MTDLADDTDAPAGAESSHPHDPAASERRSPVLTGPVYAVAVTSSVTRTGSGRAASATWNATPRRSRRG